MLGQNPAERNPGSVFQKEKHSQKRLQFKKDAVWSEYLKHPTQTEGWPGRWWNHHHWRYSKNVWMWYCGMWHSGEILPVGGELNWMTLEASSNLGDLWFHDSKADLLPLDWHSKKQKWGQRKCRILLPFFFFFFLYLSFALSHNDERMLQTIPGLSEFTEAIYFSGLFV